MICAKLPKPPIGSQPSHRPNTATKSGPVMNVGMLIAARAKNMLPTSSEVSFFIAARNPTATPPSDAMRNDAAPSRREFGSFCPRISATVRFRYFSETLRSP